MHRGMSIDANRDGDADAGPSSNHDRRLWVWTLVVVVAIYSTADLARMLADALRGSGLLGLTSDMFNVGMLLVVAMILVQGLRERSRGVEVGFALGVNLPPTPPQRYRGVPFKPDEEPHVRIAGYWFGPSHSVQREKGPESFGMSQRCCCAAA